MRFLLFTLQDIVCILQCKGNEKEVESIIKGKKIVLFGSYGWGDGQWMRDWEERMKSAGAIIIGGEGIIAHEMPQDADIERCNNFGKQLAEL